MANKRIFNELYYIIQKEKTTAKELSEKFEVSIRTIHRDINTLCESGIPIYTEVGRNGGIKLMANFRLKSALFTSEERNSLIIAIQSMALSENFENEALLTKLNALFNTKVVDWIEFDRSSWSNDYLSLNQLNEIKEAIWQSKRLRFEYVQGSAIEIRTVEPYKLIYKNYNWYVQAFCLEKHQFRLFKLSRMVHINMRDTSFDRNKSVPKIPPIIEKTIRVSLKFDKSISYRIYDEFQHAKIVEKKNLLYVEADLPDNHQLYSYILSFASHAEVIAPKNVRDKMKEISENLSILYNI